MISTEGMDRTVSLFGEVHSLVESASHSPTESGSFGDENLHEAESSKMVLRSNIAIIPGGVFRGSPLLRLPGRREGIIGEQSAVSQTREKAQAAGFRDRKKEIGPGLLQKMLADLGLSRDDLEE